MNRDAAQPKQEEVIQSAKNAKRETNITELSKGIAFEDKRPFETIFEEEEGFGLDQEIEQKNLSENPQVVDHEKSASQNKLKISFSRRSVSKPGDKKMAEKKKFSKTRFGTPSPGPSKFRKKFPRKPQQPK